MPLDMRTVVTAIAMAALSPIFLTGSPASGAGKLLTPSDSDRGTNSQQTETFQPEVKEIRPGGPPIVLGISEGTMLHLPAPAYTVYVADPDVADVQVQKEQRENIYINAKKPGRTVLYAVDDSGHVLLSKDVDVAPKPVTIIRREKVDTGEPQPPANFLVIPLQSSTIAASPASQPAGR